MALNLDGSYEQIKFHDYESVLLYNNTQYETYEPHWHASTEIIMPVKGDYTIICNGTNYYLKERDILIIAPGTVHSIPACHGQRAEHRRHGGNAAGHQALLRGVSRRYHSG